MDTRNALRGEVAALVGGGRGRSLAVVAVPWAVLIGIRMSYPVLLPYLRSTFDLTLTVAGLLITVLWLGGAVGQLPGGILSDRYSERKVMATSAVVVAAALVFIVTAPSVTVLFAATGMWGLGHSIYPIARITVLSDIYPDRIGSALGVTMATGDVGQTVLPPLVGALAVSFAWQAGLGVAVPVLVLSGVVIWMGLPETGSRVDAVDMLSSEGMRSLYATMRQPTLVFPAIALLMYSLLWQAFTAFYPTYLIEVKELSAPVAAGLFGLFFAIGVVVKPVAGSAYDRMGLRWALVVFLVGPVVGLLAIPAAQGVWPLAVVTVIVGSMLGSGTITQSYLADLFPREMRGSGLGTVRSVVFTLGSTGPVLFGLLADRGYFDEGYLVLAALLVAIILLTVWMPTS